MVAFSSEFEQTSHRALAIAKERRHAHAMLDHLLLALTDDPDAAAVMRGCYVDIEKLRRALDVSLADLGGQSVVNGDVEPVAASEVQEVIQQAVRTVPRVQLLFKVIFRDLSSCLKPLQEVDGFFDRRGVV